MTSTARPLRVVVDYWLARDPGEIIRVKRFIRRADRKYCVQVEVMRSGEPIAMLFFHHSDGSWRVFPPSEERPAMLAISQARQGKGPVEQVRQQA